MKLPMLRARSLTLCLASARFSTTFSSSCKRSFGMLCVGYAFGGVDCFPLFAFFIFSVCEYVSVFFFFAFLFSVA